MKKGKGLAIIAIILGILIVIMGCYIVYANFIQKDNNIQDNNGENRENNESEVSVSKLDSSKEWIHDANYDLPTNKESYYGYDDHTKLISANDLVVPYINIDSADAKKANQEIYELYENLINTFNDNLKEEIWFTLVEYKTYTSNNIVSVVITTESAGTGVPMYKYYTYNFNLDEGNLLSYNEAYKIAGLSENNVNDKVNQAITNALKKEYFNGDDFDTYNNKSINNYKTSINDGTIKFFIDEDQKLNIIVTLEIPAGRGQFDTIITVE